MNNSAGETGDNGRFHSSVQNPTGGTKRGLAAVFELGANNRIFLHRTPAARSAPGESRAGRRNTHDGGE